MRDIEREEVAICVVAIGTSAPVAALTFARAKPLGGAATLCLLVTVLGVVGLVAILTRRRRSRVPRARIVRDPLATARDLHSIDPFEESYDGMLHCARAALRAHDRDTAERLARDALRLRPERGDAYNVLAIVRLSQGRRSAAKALLRAGLAVDPGNPALQQNLTRVGHPGHGPVLFGDESFDVARGDSLTCRS